VKGIKPVDMILFIVFGAAYVGFQLWWAIAVALNPGGVFSFLASTTTTNANNMAILLAILVCALVYAFLGTVLNKGESGFLPSLLIRAGIALSIYTTIGQIAAVVIPNAHWTLPTQGIPVLRTVTIGVALGIFLAGIGGNMVWVGEKRDKFLQETSKKR